MVSQKADRLRSGARSVFPSKKISFSASSSSVSVFAPASVANFGVGYDVLGAALDGPGDTLTARLTRAPGVRVASISGDGGRLPLDARLNTAAVSAAAVLAKLAGRRGSGRRLGIELTLDKGLPLSSGLGSSAASAAAGAYAAGLLLGERDRLELLGAALEGERAADGSWHGDNVFAALLGGFVLVPSSDPGGTLAPVSLRFPPRVRIVVVIPALELPTRRSRGVLPRSIPMGAHTAHAGALARLVLALSSGDLAAAGACLVQDRLVDPKRLPLVRGGRAAIDALLAAGAYGACLAGAGPSVIGLTEESRDAERIGRAAVAAWRRSGVAARTRVHRIDRRGTRLTGARG
ncbi:MAG TPA: homoserine kinase [Thermoanaerobaculia bacterium]|nr:homoserine kinase [Thermoanaerobaculia bacterium]